MFKKSPAQKGRRAQVKEEKKLHRSQSRKALTEALAKTLITTTKQLIWWFTIHGTIWIYCSYILAFMKRDQIAESLSSNVCTVVIGSLIMYVVSKTIENVFKFNELGGKSNSDALKKDGVCYERAENPIVVEPPVPEPAPDDGDESDEPEDYVVNPADLG